MCVAVRRQEVGGRAEEDERRRGSRMGSVSMLVLSKVRICNCNVLNYKL